MNPNHIGSGKLQVAVTAENGALPLSNARIKITDAQDGTVLEDLATDSSGQSATIELPTPPIEFSVAENSEKPYATYNVTITAAGYETLHIGSVQVLPGSKAIQPANLRTASAGGFNVRNLLVEPHVLWGNYPSKIMEEEVKPLPEPGGFVVLPEPVIPEFVVVHLGQPEDGEAHNVWVPFKDYIKNVASSEIYATWKPETIKANVLAILSFTLNRVHTEWYRGKGYEFTVTNSTAFDQAFNVGRNIFEEISMAVDDLFTTYVTKENISQPLFTQYCDGRKTQCSGLSQWGSQALGEQGMDAVSILKRYYGADIFLASAEKVNGVPHSYGGEVLQPGSNGENVRIIQSQLNQISKNFPAIPKLKEDAVYGNSTQEAVRTFQKIFHLPRSGAVDFSTWYEISSVFVGVTKMAELG